MPSHEKIMLTMPLTRLMDAMRMARRVSSMRMIFCWGIGVGSRWIVETDAGSLRASSARIRNCRDRPVSIRLAAGEVNHALEYTE